MTASPTAADRLDQDLAARALEKRRRSQQPTRGEARALRRVEAAREERLRWEFYRTIPQKHWRAMSGRQAKVLIEQAAAYGIEFGGDAIDLPKVVRQLHDFLARNKRRLAVPEDSDPLLAAGNSPALERYREEKAQLAHLDRIEREGHLIPRRLMHDLLTRAAAILRGVGETLARDCGPEAQRILDEGLDDFNREIDSLDNDARPTDADPAAAE